MKFRSVTALPALSGFVLFHSSAPAAENNADLPPREPGALTGSAFAARISAMPLEDREQEILTEFATGNVPEWWREFLEVKITMAIDGRAHELAYRVAPDYLLIGSGTDHLSVPLTPPAAQAIADRLSCLLPTRKMADQIYAAAPVKLVPAPLSPGPEMTTVPQFARHSALVDSQWNQLSPVPVRGTLTAGHKKDVVLTPQWSADAGKVAIYGWHRTPSDPIQPLYPGHTERWVDYSHGIRLVSRKMVLDGQPVEAETILGDDKLCALLSDEGPVRFPRYDTDRTEIVRFDPGVRVVIKSPLRVDPAQPVRVVIYALPNGNTTAQTIGRPPVAGDDWHYHIQNIGAQTRWLREHGGEPNLTVAYFECAEKSWPAWRRKHDPGDTRIPRMLDAFQRRYAGLAVRLVLTGHSGGGSFTFGWLNALNEIPPQVERIAFLDSNYAWDAAKGHAAKVSRWLESSPEHQLHVFAYEDYAALLDGKSFISEAAGTWGRSHAMITDLSRTFALEQKDDEEFERVAGLSGRIGFLLKKNPERKVLHTVLVEKNGFIHALLAGTERAERGYRFYGTRVY